MTSISSINSAALLILQQTSSVAAASARQPAGSNDLAAVANGLSGTSGVSKPWLKTKAQLSDTMSELTQRKFELLTSWPPLISR